MVTESVRRCLCWERPAGASDVNFRANPAQACRAIVKSYSSLNVRSLRSIRAKWAVVILAAVVMFPACNRGRHRVLDVAYVSAPQASLRDQVSAVYNRVGTVKNGERLEIIDREKRFARVRTASGIEGWVEQRYLIDQKTFDGLQKLTQDNLNDPVQAPGVLRNDTNLHITPGRETEHLYQLASGAKIALLKRATAEKQIAAPPVAKPVSAKPGVKQPSGPVLEDWWLVKARHCAVRRRSALYRFLRS
jgi:hypothetical protein